MSDRTRARVLFRRARTLLPMPIGFLIATAIYPTSHPVAPSTVMAGMTVVVILACVTRAVMLWRRDR